MSDINRSLDTSTGCDNIDVKIIKLCSSELKRVLCKLANQSIFSGEVSDEIKLVRLIPLYKSDDKQLCNNYRPISIYFEPIVQSLNNNKFSESDRRFSQDQPR